MCYVDYKLNCGIYSSRSPLLRECLLLFMLQKYLKGKEEIIFSSEIQSVYLTKYWEEDFSCAMYMMYVIAM